MERKFVASAACALAALVIASDAHAQSDFVRSHGKFLMGAIQPPSAFKLDASFQPNVGVEDTNVEADLVKVKARIGRVFGVNNDTAVVAAFNYGLRDYQFDDVGPLRADLDESLHEIAVELGAHWFVRDDTLLSFTFRPGIFSDLDDGVGSDDFQWHGNAVATYQWNDKWFLKLGVAVGEDFDETNVIPIGGFSWVSSDLLRVDVLLPKSATVTWRPWDELSILIVPGIHLEGQQYHVEVGDTEGDIQIQDIRADITASYEVSKAARVSLSVGSNFRGKYEVEGDGGLDEDADQDPSLYVAIGFGSNF